MSEPTSTCSHGEQESIFAAHKPGHDGAEKARDLSLHALRDFCAWQKTVAKYDQSQDYSASSRAQEMRVIMAVAVKSALSRSLEPDSLAHGRRVSSVLALHN